MGEVVENKKKTFLFKSTQLGKVIEVEKELFKPLYRGSQMKRFSMIEENRSILFPYFKEGDLIPEKQLKDNYPLTYKYLLENKKTLEIREEGRFKGEKWYGYGRTQALDVISQKKIITPDLAKNTSFVFDETGSNYFVGGAAGGYGLVLKNGWDYHFVLGLLNSSLLDWFIKTQGTQMESGFFSFEARFIRSAPIFTPKNPNEEVIKCVKNLIDLNEKIKNLETDSEKALYLRQINSFYSRLNKEVFNLYKISPEEIRIIEAAAVG